MVPTPTDITYFYEVATAKNFSHAAIKLGVSQPSLSLAIKRLEKNLGVTLFARHKQGVTLTKAGKKFILQVKPLLQHWQNTKLQTYQAHANISGEITIGCHSAIGLFLHHLMGNLLEEFPELLINLHHDNSQKITDHVIQGNVDIGLVTSPIKHPDLIIRKLNGTETTFWKGKGKRQIQNIQSEKLVVLCDPNASKTQILLRKWKSKIQHARIITVNSLEVIANLIANNCGIGILPSCFISSIYEKKLERVSSAPVCTDEIFLIYRKESREVKAVELIVNAIKKGMNEILKNGSST